MTISAIISVYNEERRIEATLRSLVWCDEIVILDKQSTDHTCEIAQRYTNKIIQVPWQDFRPEENQIMLDQTTSEWILSATASDLIHPRLAAQICELTQHTDFPYDVIHVPYRRYVLGLETKHSPWYGRRHSVVFRKSVARIRDDVHGALTFDTRRHYEMPISTNAYMYHLTHATVDGMMERHTRYWRAEARLISSDVPLRNALKPILKSFYELVFRRRSYLMGWGGIALGMAYISYWMLRFVYIWELRRSKAPQTYQNIRESILQAWEQSEATKHV